MAFFEDCKTEEEVKRKYRNLAKEHHPDMGGNAETFKKIQKEYENWNNSSKINDEKVKWNNDDDVDPFCFKQNKNYTHSGSYSDIRFDHPIFRELHYLRHLATRYQYILSQFEIQKKSELQDYKRDIEQLKISNKFYYVEIQNLKKELSKKKATTTRLKNKIKKMQEKSVSGSGSNNG